MRLSIELCVVVRLVGTTLPEATRRVAPLPLRFAPREGKELLVVDSTRGTGWFQLEAVD